MQSDEVRRSLTCATQSILTAGKGQSHNQIEKTCTPSKPRCVTPSKPRCVTPSEPRCVTPSEPRCVSIRVTWTDHRPNRPQRRRFLVKRVAGGDVPPATRRPLLTRLDLWGTGDRPPTTVDILSRSDLLRIAIGDMRTAAFAAVTDQADRSNAEQGERGGFRNGRDVRGVPAERDGVAQRKGTFYFALECVWRNAVESSDA